MARSTEPAAAPIYALHARWLNDVLPRGDSLFTPGAAIWKREHLDELTRDFIGQPDVTHGKTYLDKLRDQLAQSSDRARQLMAELHAVHFLIIRTSSISAAKKLSDMRAILSWMQSPVDVPADVEAAMSPGLVHPGQWVLTRRDTQISWLIEFSRAAVERPGGIPDDPWEVRAFAESVSTSTSADAARLALLHLAWPDTFEQSVSATHRRMMVTRFSALSYDRSDDVDRRLLQIRAILTATHGEGFSFYAPQLERQWWRSKAWKPFMKWLEKCRAEPRFDEYERDYKLRLADRLAAARKQLGEGDARWTDELRAAFDDHDNNITNWRVKQPFLRWLADDTAAAGDALRQLWADEGSSVARLQDFLRALPADLLPQPGQRLNFGTFLLMADGASESPPVKISVFRKAWRLSGFAEPAGNASVADLYEHVLAFLDELRHDASSWATPLRDRLDAQGAVWQLTTWDVEKEGLPRPWSDADWEAFEAWRSANPQPNEEDDDDAEAVDDEAEEAGDESEDVEEPTVDHIAAAAEELCVDRAVLDEIIQLLEDKRQVVLYGPPGTGKTYLALRLARAIATGDEARVSIVQFHPATTYEDFFEGLRPALTDSGQVYYKRTEGPLVDIADRAAADPGHTYVMVIDELNRANLPKVLGELLFLLEYRKEAVRTLYRPTTPFTLPQNLWFIATMNTADRSVALIDAAMRRRFHYVPFFPHEGAMRPLLRNWLQRHNLPTRVADFLDAVNNSLVERLGDHLLVGPSHFMKSDLSEASLERIWTYNVFPLLEELLWGQRDEIDQWRWPRVRQRFATQLAIRIESPADSDLPAAGADGEHGQERSPSDTDERVGADGSGT